MAERFRREHFEMRPYAEGLWVRYSDYAALEADNLRLQNEWDNSDEMLQACRSRIAALEAQNKLWQQNMREAYEAFTAMRNDLNELFPMQSAEADLLDGPEWSVACAAIVDAARDRSAALEAQLANVKERAKDAASMCEAGYPVSAFNLATSILSALEATPPAPKVTATTDHDPKLGTTLHLMKQSWESRQPTNSTSVETIPHRWECEFPAGSMFVDTEAAANVYADQGAKITPLYTAPPAPKVAELDWKNGEARSPSGDLYEVENLGGSVWVVRQNGTSLLGWHSSREDACARAQAISDRKALTAAQEAGKP